MNRSLYCMALIFVSLTSFACIGVDINEPSNSVWLIGNTPNIYLAEAVNVKKARHVKYSNLPGEYTFKVLETLKGRPLSTVRIMGDRDLNSMWDTTFNDHRTFGAHGRLGNIGDCVTTVAPAFVIGSTYVLFLDGPDDSKKFEKIATPDDGWLQHIRETLKPTSEQRK